MQQKFDPMTGKPIVEQKFDPMTGEPIVEQKFDPMTGQPIMQKKFDPMTGQPLGEEGMAKPPKKKGKAAGIIIAAAGVAVIAIGGFALAKSGLFLGSSNKVLIAAANTFADAPEVFADLSEVDVNEFKEFTLKMGLEADGGSVNGSFINDKSEKQIVAAIDIPGVPAIDVIAGLDDEYVKLQIPSVNDNVLAYNYTKEKTGFIADNVDYEDIEMLDEMILSIYESSVDSSEMSEKLTQVISDEYKELEFEKVDKEEYEVNGKDVKCKGYMTSITSDNMLNIIDGMEVVYDEYYGESSGVMEEMTGESLSEAFDEMRDTFVEMPDMDVTFYVHKNMLACINLDVQGYETEVRFLGGDTRMQNMEIIVDGYEVMTIEGEKDGSEEIISVDADGEKIMYVEYDEKSGDFYLDIYDGEMGFEGVLTAKKNELTVVLDSIISYGEYVGTGTFSITKGASLEKFDGDMFDIGNASESELEDLVYDYEELIEELYYYY